MKLYRYDEIPEKAIRRSYRHAGWRALAAAALFMGVITAYVALPKYGPTNPVLIAVPGSLTLLLGVLMLLRARAGAHKHNWILKESEAGLYVNLRPAHNLHLSDDDPCVLFVPTAEIGALGRSLETRELPDRNGPSIYHWSYIDIYLTHDNTDEVVQRLRAERRLNQKRHAGVYPVQVLDPPAVRLMWDWIRPAEDAAMRRLGEHWSVAPDRKINHGPWDDLSDATKAAVIAELWEQGHLLEAHRAYRMWHGVTAKKAWIGLEELVKD